MKCRSCSNALYNNEFILGSACIGSNRSQNQWDVLSRFRFETDAASRHSCSIISEFFVFQQDSAPSHRAKDRVALLDQETPDFIHPAVSGHLKIPDLNPVDYTVWSVHQERGYRTKISDVDDLKRRITSKWAPLSHTVVECAVVEWRQHLACVRAVGGHFEHTLQ